MSEQPCKRDPDAWFEEREISMRVAKARCRQLCGLQWQCLELAMTLEGNTKAPSARFGVWGGLDGYERATLGRKRHKAAQKAQA